MVTVKVLAIDQSTKATGVSFWENNSLTEHFALLVSEEKTEVVNGKNKKIKKVALERQREMYFLIKETVEKYKPDFLVFENVQFQNNYSTFQQLSQLQGLLMSICIESAVGFTIVEPSKWKGYCGVKGRKREEQKASAIQMVKDRFGIEASEDECEAVLIGFWAVHNLEEIK